MAPMGPVTPPAAPDPGVPRPSGRAGRGSSASAPSAGVPLQDGLAPGGPLPVGPPQAGPPQAWPPAAMPVPVPGGPPNPQPVPYPLAASAPRPAPPSSPMAGSRGDWLDVICPYLRAADGTWRSAVPAREHRCWAFEPVIELPGLTQQRLCLTQAHSGCERFLHAQERRAAALARDHIAPERVETARFGPSSVLSRWLSNTLRREVTGPERCPRALDATACPSCCWAVRPSASCWWRRSSSSGVSSTRHRHRLADQQPHARGCDACQACLAAPLTPAPTAAAPTATAIPTPTATAVEQTPGPTPVGATPTPVVSAEPPEPPRACLRPACRCRRKRPSPGSAIGSRMATSCLSWRSSSGSPCAPSSRPTTSVSHLCWYPARSSSSPIRPRLRPSDAAPPARAAGRPAAHQTWQVRHHVVTKPPGETSLSTAPQRGQGCPPLRWTCRKSRTSTSKRGGTRSRSSRRPRPAPRGRHDRAARSPRAPATTACGRAPAGPPTGSRRCSRCRCRPRRPGS